MEEKMKSRLVEFDVNGLFGLYSYNIKLNTDARITAIIGPNGRGKTICLKCIEAIYNRNYLFFKTFPFISVKFSFSGGEEVVISHDIDSPEIQGDHKFVTKEHSDIKIEFKSGGSVYPWTPKYINDRGVSGASVSRYLPFIERIAPDRWHDGIEGDAIELYEVINRYQDRLPEAYLSRFHSNEPERFRDLVSSIKCHLIETQRLFSSQMDVQEEYYDHRRPHSRAPSFPALTVQQKASTLKRILQDTLTKYATLSQSLDRSFPRRVLEESRSTALNGRDLPSELDRLDDRRKALMDAGILATEFEPVTISKGKIETNVARVLQIYIEDTDKKLCVFDDILNRIRLFKNLVEARFSDKTLKIDRECGFEVRSQTSAQIPLEKLSSGEQHQIILIFELLFEVTENSLILIDEPELSLHVTWQKTFIDSLQKMIKLNKFDVVIATHSPPLVARHFGLTVELGSVDN